MIFKTYEINVDLIKDAYAPEVICFSQNDLNSAKLLLNIKKMAEELDLSQAKSVRMSFKKPDGTRVFQNDCQPINPLKGKYQIVLKTQTLTAAGDVIAQVHIEEEDRTIDTQAFYFKVNKSLSSDEAIESTNEFGVIQKVIEAGEKLEGVDIPALVASKETAEQAKAASAQNANQIGILSELETVEKSNLVKAINEAKDSGLTEQQKQDIDSAKTEATSAKAEATAARNDLVSKADKTYVDTKVSAVASGSPKGTYATLTDLQTAKPTGDSNIYVVTSDGKWYYWNSSTWTAGGVYQSTGIAAGSVTKDKVNQDVFDQANKNMSVELTKQKKSSFVLNEYVGSYKGTKTWNKQNLTYDYIDTPADAPFLAADIPKSIKLNINAASAGSGFLLHNINNCNEQTKLITGAWFRKSDLLALTSGSFEPYFALLNASSASVGGGGTGGTPYTDMVQVGYKKTGVITGVSYVLETKVEYNGWVYISFSMGALTATGVKTATMYFPRFGGLTAGATGKVDVIATSLLKDELDIQPSVVYPDTVDDIPQNKMNTLATDVAALKTGGSKRIDIKNSDRITMIGDSNVASHYVLKGKSFVQILSELSDYNWENYGRSGYHYQSVNTDIRNNVPYYHPSLTYKDYNSKYALLLSNSNDWAYKEANPRYYYDNLKGIIETVKAIGAEPVIVTRYNWHANGDIRELKGLQNVADQYGIKLIDTTTKSKLMCKGVYLPYWGNLHMGTRTTYVILESLLRQLKSLPRPKQSLKLFRKRDSFASSAINDLLFDKKEERHKKFKEILTGHYALDDATKTYFDELDVKNDNAVVNSEYLKLQNKEAVSFKDYGLIELVLPGTAVNIDKVTLNISDPSVKVYGRHMFQSPFEGANIKQAFRYTSDVTGLQANAVYTTPDYNGENLTVLGVYDGLVITNRNYAHSDATAGTLTKVSGNGPATITYDARKPGFEPAYYDQLFKPEGKWVELSGGLGSFTINKSNLKNYMNYDKMSFLLYKQGGFSLNDVYATYEGEGGKVTQSLQLPREATGAQLLTEMYLTNNTQLAKWTTTGSVTSKVATDALNYPFAIEGHIELLANDSNSVSQTFAYQQEPEVVKDAEIKVWARYNPPKHDPAKPLTESIITEDSYDLATLAVEITEAGDIDSQVRYEESVGLHWKEVTIRCPLPTFTTSQTMRLFAIDKNIEVCRASVRIIS